MGWLIFLALASPFACLAQDVFTVSPRVATEDRYPQRRTEFANGVIGWPDLPYAAPAGFRSLRLDLYHPGDLATAHPLVLFVHGGAWQSGDRRHSGAFENWPDVLAALAAR